MFMTSFLIVIVIYLGKPDGPTCHTGLETCYYTSVSDLLSDKQVEGNREEADELCRTMEENEDKSRTASEMADVLYHAMVLVALKDVKAKDVLEVLRKRFSESGIEEKSSRTSQS
ncbi:hypothetical protein Pint_22551 [Pistacia integerrima]|uniref:Uncharacterized protein n=1 Tax=Pistacia integerrima TaxID=434235 RepID=A0ACC0YMB5_9ROSI|nr:hypothetical protein Pint_22551 [Pistacia integerrima]